MNAVPVDAGMVTGWREQLTAAATMTTEAGGSGGLDDAGRVDLLRALEELACAAAGVQAVVTAGFDTSQRAVQAAAGVPVERRGRGVGSQVGLARRVSPHLGARYLGLARVLVDEMPHTLAALTLGKITQWRVMVIARETACLSREHRALVDERLAGSAERVAELEGWSDRRLSGELARWAQELEVEAVVARRRRAEVQRRVSGRAAPDVMMYLSALLPAKDGVAVLAALNAAATEIFARPGGDSRSRGRIMAAEHVDEVDADDPDPVLSPGLPERVRGLDDGPAAPAAQVQPRGRPGLAPLGEEREGVETESATVAVHALELTLAVHQTVRHHGRRFERRVVQQRSKIPIGHAGSIPGLAAPVVAGQAIAGSGPGGLGHACWRGSGFVESWLGTDAAKG